MLARIFYSNLKYIDVVLIYEVKKHKTRLTLEEFTYNYNLSCTDSNYGTEEEGNKF